MQHNNATIKVNVFFCLFYFFQILNGEKSLRLFQSVVHLLARGRFVWQMSVQAVRCTEYIYNIMLFYRDP